MGSSRPLTSALPFICFCLALLSASHSTARSEASGAGGQRSLQSNTNPSSASPTNASIRLQQTGGEWVLEARQAPLPQILQTITEKTGAQIHYSVLPEAPVSATCAGKTAQAHMECLVAKQIGLVAHKDTKSKPAEFWLPIQAGFDTKKITQQDINQPTAQERA